MSARVIPIRRGQALASAYPLPVDGVHLSADGDGWRLTKNKGGASIAMLLTDAEVETVVAMGQLALEVRGG